MITNRDLVQKTKPLLKDSYLQVFACILLASILPQIFLSVSPQSILLNIVVTCLSAYLQVGIALYCIEIYKGIDTSYTTIFSRFVGFKPILIMLLLVTAIFLGFILFIIPGIILALMYSQVFFILADDPDVGVIILGKNAPIEQFKTWFSVARSTPHTCGFAIGRSIFWEAWEQFAEGKINKSEVSEKIAECYQQVIDIWQNI